MFSASASFDTNICRLSCAETQLRQGNYVRQGGNFGRHLQSTHMWSGSGPVITHRLADVGRPLWAVPDLPLSTSHT